MTEKGIHTYILSIGSNAPDATKRVENALGFLGRHLSNFNHSTIYSTPPAGEKKYADYTNTVAAGFSTLEPGTLNSILKQYERDNGRTTTGSAIGLVAIDLDIVIVDGEVIRPRDFKAEYFTIGYNELNNG